MTLDEIRIPAQEISLVAHAATSEVSAETYVDANGWTHWNFQPRPSLREYFKRFTQAPPESP